PISPPLAATSPPLLDVSQLGRGRGRRATANLELPAGAEDRRASDEATGSADREVASSGDCEVTGPLRRRSDAEAQSLAQHERTEFRALPRPSPPARVS